MAFFFFFIRHNCYAFHDSSCKGFAISTAEAGSLRSPFEPTFRSELLVARYLKQVGKEVSSHAIQEYFKKSKQWVSWVMNGKNGDGGLLSKMPNVIEEDVTAKGEKEIESVHRKMYRFVGEWNDFAISEKIAQIID